MGDVVSFASVTKSRPKLRLVRREKPVAHVDIKIIIDFVCRFEYVTPMELFSDERSSDIVKKRDIARYLCCKLSGQSMAAIGRFWGGDHSTTQKSRKRIEHQRKLNILLDYKLAAYEEALFLIGKP